MDKLTKVPGQIRHIKRQHNISGKKTTEKTKLRERIVTKKRRINIKLRTQRDQKKCAISPKRFQKGECKVMMLAC
jgi:hypothetical protein